MFKESRRREDGFWGYFEVEHQTLGQQISANVSAPSRRIVFCVVGFLPSFHIFNLLNALIFFHSDDAVCFSFTAVNLLRLAYVLV